MFVLTESDALILILNARQHLLGELMHCRERFAAEVGDLECSASVGGDQEGSTEVALDEADLVSERARTHMQVFRSGAEVGIPDYPGEAL